MEYLILKINHLTLTNIYYLKKFFGIIRQVSGPNDSPVFSNKILEICDFKNLNSNESLREEKFKI